MAIVRHKQPPLRRLMMYGVDHVRQAFASLGELWRNPLASLMTLAVLGVSLALPSCFHVLLKNAEVVEGSWQTSSQISLYLRKDLPEQSILDMKQRILLYPEVESVTYMNRDEALREFREISGFGDALDYLDSNPLPPVLSVIPDPRWQNRKGRRAARQAGERARYRAGQAGSAVVDPVAGDHEPAAPHHYRYRGVAALRRVADRGQHPAPEYPEPAFRD